MAKKPTFPFSAPAAIVVFGTLASVAYTVPVVSHLTSAIPYTFAVPADWSLENLVPGDHLQFYYALSLTAEMVRGEAPWFQDPYQFSAPEPPKRSSFFFLPFSLLFAAMAAPLGGPAAYNLLLLSSFPATALSVFLLARRLGLDWRGATVAATAVMLLPYRIASLADGHPTGLSFFLLPLALYFLERAWQDASRGAAAAGGLTLVVLAVNEPHLLYFFAFLLPLWLVFAAWRIEPRRRAADLAPSLVLLAVAAAGPATVWALQEARRGAVWRVDSAFLLWLASTAAVAVAWRFTAEIRARADEPAWKAEAAAYLPLAILALYAVSTVADVPNLGRALFAIALGGLVVLKLPVLRALGRLGDQPAYRAALRRLAALWPLAFGFVAAVLLLIQYKRSAIDASALAEGRSMREIILFAPRVEDFFRRSNAGLNHQLYPGAVVAGLAIAGLATPSGRAMALAAVTFAVLALGPSAPQGLPLYAIAYRLVPVFDMIRQPAKLFAVAAVALALAAGFGMSVLWRRASPVTRRWIFVAGLTAILADLTVVLPLGVCSLPTENEAYAAVAERARGTNLLELPLWPGDSAYSSIYQYWALRTKVPIVNGYSAATASDYVERVFRPLESMNAGELSEQQSRRLDDLRVRYVTLHRDTYPPKVNLYPYRFALTAMRGNPHLRFVIEDDGVYLFERAGEAGAWQPSIPWQMGVFYEAEQLILGAGRRLEDAAASGGMLVGAMRSTGAGPVGPPVMYGPYRSVPRGRYEVRFRIRGTGKVDAATDSGRRLLGEAAVNAAEWQEVPLSVDVDRQLTIEWRAWAEASSEPKLEIDWVLITKLDPLESGRPAGRFEAEEMVALYGVDHDSPDASAGGYAVVVHYPPGKVMRDGPYRAFGPGRVHLGLRSRRGGMRVSVESPDGRRRFAEVEVPSSPAWTMTEADFDLAAREILCARLVSVGADGDVDYVELANAP